MIIMQPDTRTPDADIGSALKMIYNLIGNLFNIKI